MWYCASIFKSNTLAKEAQEYWFSKGISPSKSSAILQVISLIEEGVIKARFSKNKTLHAKLLSTDSYAFFGSSNFSESGLKKNREFNSSSMIGEEEYNVVRNFVKGCIMESVDYTDLFKETLQSMLNYVGWEEALGKACSSLLEGHWVDSEMSGSSEQWDNLWRHQKQAVAQALSLAEIQGGALIADPTGSGKTNSMAMSMRVVFNRLVSKNIGTMESLVPVLVSPPAVVNNWHAAFDRVGISPQVLSQGILSNPGKQSSQNRVKLISRAPLLGVDEAHNFYSKTSNRTDRLMNHNADATILATATPINTGFTDLVKALEIMGIGLYDPEVMNELKNELMDESTDE